MVEVIGHAPVGVAGAGVQVGVNLPATLVLTGGDRNPRCRTDGRVHVEVGQLDSLVRKPINVGSLHKRIAEASRVGKPHVIDKDEEEVWLLTCGLRRVQVEARRQDKEAEKGNSSSLHGRRSFLNPRLPHGNNRLLSEKFYCPLSSTSGYHKPAFSRIARSKVGPVLVR